MIISSTAQKAVEIRTLNSYAFFLTNRKETTTEVVGIEDVEMFGVKSLEL